MILWEKSELSNIERMNNGPLIRGKLPKYNDCNMITETQ